MKRKREQKDQMKIICYALLLSLSFSVNGSAQSFDNEKYNKEKEKILNTIINSVQFDSIYFSKRVYFASNELLSKSTCLVLKKGKCKIRIQDPAKLKLKQRGYVSIGDFTMPKENPTYVRVQLYSSSTSKILNLRLEKINDEWVIVNHLIMED